VTLDADDPVRGRGDELDGGALASGEAARREPAVRRLGGHHRGDLATALALDLENALLPLEGGLGGVAGLGGDEAALTDGPLDALVGRLAVRALAGEPRHPGSPRTRLRARWRVRGPVQRALPDEVPGSRLPLDLALDVPQPGAPDRMLERDVEQLVLLDDGLALGQVGDREPHALARPLGGCLGAAAGVGRR